MIVERMIKGVKKIYFVYAVWITNENHTQSPEWIRILRNNCMKNR